MKLPKGVYQRNKSSPQLWILYMDENGKRILESAHTTDPTIAENFRNLRLGKVAEAKLIPTRNQTLGLRTKRNSPSLTPGIWVTGSEHSANL
jgi:hypothetical protein